MSDDDVLSFYQDGYDESDRLSRAHGQLEMLRTQHIVGKHLLAAGLRIADIGGGPGTYAAWLANLGHHVVVVDPVERHVEAVRDLDTTAGSLAAQVGDARSLPFDDGSFDAVLFLGPLYHLQEPSERRKALSEAARVLRPSGQLFAGAVSRFTSLHDGLARRWLTDPEFAAIALTDLATGRHENPNRRQGWFTTAYFHRPEELRAEVESAGFVGVSVVGLEGLAGWLDDLDDRLDDTEERAVLLDVLDRAGAEPSILGVSAHLLAHGTKPARRPSPSTEPIPGTAGTVPAGRSVMPMPDVGDVARRTRRVRATDIELFTQMTGDRNPLHYDEDLTARSRFGGVIVQGGVTSGLLNAIVAEDLPGPGSVFLHVDWSFTAPVRPGEEITAEVEVLEVRADKPITRLRTTITNQDGTVVLDGTALVYTETLE